MNRNETFVLSLAGPRFVRECVVVGLWQVAVRSGRQVRFQRARYVYGQE